MVFFSKTTRATAGPRWFGIDLAKRESQVAVLDADDPGQPSVLCTLALDGPWQARETRSSARGDPG